MDDNILTHTHTHIYIYIYIYKKGHSIFDFFNHDFNSALLVGCFMVKMICLKLFHTLMAVKSWPYEINRRV